MINPGLCVYDFSRLLEGSLEVHMLSEAMVRSNNFIDYNRQTQTISFIKDYTSIVMIPLLHRNNIKFFGMGDKRDYLIWKQQKGTFTALDKKLNLTSWSTVTGKMIHTKSSKSSIEVKDENSLEQIKGLSVSEPFKQSIQMIVKDKEIEIKEGFSRKEIRKKYELYQANINDQTYLRNWNTFEKFSFSLIVSS